MGPWPIGGVTTVVNPRIMCLKNVYTGCDMPNIRDVAKRADVSPATVSHVLNNRLNLVRPSTRAKVLTAVRDLGYQPRGFTTHKKALQIKTIGVLFRHTSKHPLVDYNYYQFALDGILETASNRDAMVSVIMGSRWNHVEDKVRLFIQGRCDGVIVISPASDRHLIEILRERGVATVAIGGGFDFDILGAADVDDNRGATLAMEYLISLGHRRIAWIGGGDWCVSTGLRSAAYKRILEDNGIPFDPRICQIGEYEPEWGYQKTVEMFSRADIAKPTAVLYGSDHLATGGMKAFKDLKMEVPHDVSVIGFDGLPSPDPDIRALTSIRQPVDEIGAAAAHILLDHLDGLQVRPKAIFEPVLAVRSTTAPPSRKE